MRGSFGVGAKASPLILALIAGVGFAWWRKTH